MTRPALPLVLRAAFILIGCVLLARGLGLALVRRSPSRMAAREKRATRRLRARVILPA